MSKLIIVDKKEIHFFFIQRMIFIYYHITIKKLFYIRLRRKYIKNIFFRIKGLLDIHKYIKNHITYVQNNKINNNNKNSKEKM